jgi:hypothetical protein
MSLATTRPDGPTRSASHVGRFGAAGSDLPAPPTVRQAGVEQVSLRPRIEQLRQGCEAGAGLDLRVGQQVSVVAHHHSVAVTTCRLAKRLAS